MYKGLEAEDAPTGRALIDMLYGCQHRGPDSTGFALYGNAEPDQYHLRFFLEEDNHKKSIIGRIRDVIAEQRAKIVGEESVWNNYHVTVKFQGDLQPFAYAIEQAAKVISIGTSLTIIKDIGSAHDVDKHFKINAFQGSHGIGHVRLATESEVRPEAAHPFWATGFSDVAIVHNGQITNYWKMRRRLEQRGFEFRTNNDSELIAVYLADKLTKGGSLEKALGDSIDDLDGTFSFLVSTLDEIGYAKDRLAAKPMILYEDNDLIAVASEEVSLNRLFPGRALDTREPAPGTFKTWSRST